MVQAERIAIAFERGVGRGGGEGEKRDDPDVFLHADSVFRSRARKI